MKQTIQLYARNNNSNKATKSVNNFCFQRALSSMEYKNNFPQMVREAGFKLRQYRDGPLDWRLMGTFETELILREQNFELLDTALAHLAEAPLGNVLDTHILDSGIAKYFAMAQYAIQYLLCCRTYLDESANELREANNTAQQEILKLRQALAESNNEIVQLHKKLTQIEAIREVVYPCHLCTKNFISNDALNIHIGRKHGVAGRQLEPSAAAANGKQEKETDMQLINTIKMELEIKQLKERLNAAERNIMERSSLASGSKKQRTREESKACTSTTVRLNAAERDIMERNSLANSSKNQSTQEESKQSASTWTSTKATVRNVGIQSNLMERKEKDELSSADSETSERKEQLHGLEERISNFESWQAQLKQSNDQFIVDINQKLEGLTSALEHTKQRAQAETTVATAVLPDERGLTPSLEDLERILTEKVAEIGKASADKLEEVVHHLEMGYKDKLEALDRQLRQMSARKEPPETQTVATTSKIPKPVAKEPKQETSFERIKRLVESEFLEQKKDDDTFSIEEIKTKEPSAHKVIQPKQQVTQVEQVLSDSSASQQTYTKPAPEDNVPKAQTVSTPTATVKPTEIQEATDVSESLSEEEPSVSNEDSELSISEPVRQIFKPASSTTTRAKIKPRKSPQKPLLPLTRKDARKLVNRKLSVHGFDLKSKSISHTSVKRINAELQEQRQKLKLEFPSFYATRNRMRKFVDKLCSTQLSERAQVILKQKTPLQPIETPRRTSQRSRPVVTDVDTTAADVDDETASDQSHDSSKRSDFKAHLEQILVKPSPRALPEAAQAGQPAIRPVPLPRKRVMFNTNNTSFDAASYAFK